MPRALRRSLPGGERKKTNFVRWAHVFKRQQTLMARARPWPRSGDRSKAVMVGVIGRLRAIESGGTSRVAASHRRRPCQRHAVHQAAKAVIVVDRIVLGAAVVPERHRALDRKRVV